MAEVKYRIVGKDDSKKAVKSATKGMQGMEKAAKSLGKVFSLAMVGVALVAVKKLSAGINKLTDAYYVQEAAEKKLAAALRATGNTLGITQKEMHKTAAEMQKMTTYGDEAIISAQAMMVTFTRIGKDVFPAAIEAAADMSTMFGQDLQSSVVQLGTALNDPIVGVGRLQRIGVAFTESQKESIKAFVEQNDLLSAQTIILDELKNEFGGVALAMGRTRQGIAKQFAAQVGDIKEQVGDIFSALKTDMFKALSPVLENISKWFTDNGPKIYAIFTNIVPIMKMSFDLVVTIIRNALSPAGFSTTLEALGGAIATTVKSGIEALPVIFTNTLLILIDILDTMGPLLAKKFSNAILGTDFGPDVFVPSNIGGQGGVLGQTFSMKTTYKSLDDQIEHEMNQLKARIVPKGQVIVKTVVENIKTSIAAYTSAIGEIVDLSSEDIEKYFKDLEALLNEGAQTFEALQVDTTPIGGGGGGGGTTTPEILAEIAEIIPSMYEQMKLDTKEQQAYMSDVLKTYNRVSQEVETATRDGDGEQLGVLMPMLEQLKKILGIVDKVHKIQKGPRPGYDTPPLWAQIIMQNVGQVGGQGTLPGPEAYIPAKATVPFLDTLGPVVGMLAEMFLSLQSVVLILDPLRIIFQAMMDTIGPLINEALKPVIGFLSILGQTLGKLLIPIIQALAPFIEAALKQFIWLYNVLVPVLNILYKFLLTVKYVLSVLRTIGTNIGIWFYNLVHRKAKHKAYEELPGEPDLKKNYFEKIDLEDVYASGDQATGGGGGGASYTSGRDITINMEINTDVIVGDRREMAIWIAAEIKEALDLGLVV